jgi:hypothetical protein
VQARQTPPDQVSQSARSTWAGPDEAGAGVGLAELGLLELQTYRFLNFRRSKTTTTTFTEKVGLRKKERGFAAPPVGGVPRWTASLPS